MRSSWIMVSSSLSLQLQFDVAQHRIGLAGDFVFDQRAAAGAEELPERRPIVNVASPVADVRVGGADVVLLHDAGILVVVADRPQIGGALGACQVQAVAL